ncbi:MAG: TPM domain-containing protein [Candidatus Margulisiibacteriota bacterium]
MKKILFFVVCCLFFAGSIYSQENLPAYSGFVNDFAGILDSQSSAKINELSKQLESKTSAEMAIAIVKTTAPLVPKEYAVKLFKKWGIGKKGKDNGILILLSMEDRRVEIEVGYGLEGAINDAKAGKILDDYVIPFFKKGDFAGGLYNGAEAIAAEVAKEGKTDLGAGYQGYKGTDASGGNDSMIINILTFAVIAFVFVMAIAPPWAVGIVGGLIGGCVGILSGGMGAALFGGIIGFGVSTLFAWVMAYFAKNYKGGSGGTSSGGGMFSGWGGGSGSSGGGFSLGGGGSGGGGAGRSW